MIKMRWVALSAVLALVACGEQQQAKTTPEPESTAKQAGEPPQAPQGTGEQPATTGDQPAY